jgi:thiamine transporter ThiT
MTKKTTKKMVLSALFIALGLVLPFFTGQIPQIGSRLLPMHIPILLCGFVCGAPFGLAAGFITPLLRSLIFGMPPMMPTAVAMAFELAAYGLFVIALNMSVDKQQQFS